MCSFGSHRLVELFSASKCTIPWLYWLSVNTSWMSASASEATLVENTEFWATQTEKYPQPYFICENEILYLLFHWMGGSGWRVISQVSEIMLWASVGCWRETCTIWSAFSSAAMLVFNFVHLKAKKIFPALTFTAILCLLLNIWKVCRS